MTEQEHEIYTHRVLKLQAKLKANWHNKQAIITDIGKEREAILKAIEKINTYVETTEKVNIPYVFGNLDYIEQHVNLIEKQMRLY